VRMVTISFNNRVHRVSTEAAKPARTTQKNAQKCNNSRRSANQNRRTAMEYDTTDGECMPHNSVLAAQSYGWRVTSMETSVVDRRWGLPRGPPGKAAERGVRPPRPRLSGAL
jgi:hypothetical protein